MKLHWVMPHQLQLHFLLSLSEEKNIFGNLKVESDSLGLLQSCFQLQALKNVFFSCFQPHRITLLFVNIYSTTHPGGENRGDMRAMKEIVKAARKDVVKSRKKKAGVWDKCGISMR